MKSMNTFVLLVIGIMLVSAPNLFGREAGQTLAAKSAKTGESSVGGSYKIGTMRVRSASNPLADAAKYSGESCFQRTLSDAEINRIVAAIYRIEGGDKARVPYGILSVKVKDKEAARKVCYNTVRNNYVRWTKAVKPDDFAKFIATRYCPPSADAVGHKNWVNNFRKIVGKVK